MSSFYVTLVVLQCLCVSVRVSLCLLAYLKDDISKVHEIFCLCYLWPRLSPALTSVQYVMCSWFCG